MREIESERKRKWEKARKREEERFRKSERKGKTKNGRGNLKIKREGYVERKRGIKEKEKELGKGGKNRESLNKTHYSELSKYSYRHLNFGC